MAIYTDRNGKEIFLDRELGKGGEASVYSIQGKSDLVAKIYNDHHSIDKQKLEKLEKMCDLFDDKIAEYYAWPQQIIYSKKKAIGFIMENINSKKQSPSKPEYIKIIKFYVSQDRRKFFPNVEYKFIVHAALNLARAICTLHEKGIVIGDINESNIFVNNGDATIKLIDCDSYQIEDFMCNVGKADYTAPELPSELRGVKRTANHDCFALAVMLFLMLVGKHPYSGLGTPQEFRQAIIQDMYCYGNDAKKKGISSQWPFSELHELLNDEIKDLFEQAFCTHKRPIAKDWIRVLEKYENELIKCTNDDGHWYHPNYQKCIWCELQNDGFFAFGQAPTQKNKIVHNYSKQTPYQTNFKRQTNTNSYNNNYTNNNFTSTSNAYSQSSTSMNPALKYFIIISVIILIAVIVSIDSENTSPPTQINYNTNTQRENYRYPECDADSTLKPMKNERTTELRPLLENSQYLLNANYSLWYRNITSNGDGTCSSDEMIKDLFWADPTVYLVHRINYSTSYDNNRIITRHNGFSDLADLINNSEYYSGNRKLSQSEINSLLEKSLPENSVEDVSPAKTYTAPITNVQSTNVSKTITNKTAQTQTNITEISKPKAVTTQKSNPEKEKNDLKKSSDDFFE